MKIDTFLKESLERRPGSLINSLLKHQVPQKAGNIQGPLIN
jgi:hypothetical protein